MTWTSSIRRSLLLLTFCCAAIGKANAVTTTLTGSLSNDSSVFNYSIVNPSTATYNFTTTSYATGGFVPILTLFSASTGKPIDFGGAGFHCVPFGLLCEDANFTDVLGPGSYVLDLAEFPNVPTGNLTDPFLAMGDTSFTGTNCGVPGGKFLQADVAPCVQRSANYTVVFTSTPSTSPVPEPSTWLLMLTAGAALTVYNRRRLA